MQGSLIGWRIRRHGRDPSVAVDECPEARGAPPVGAEAVREALDDVLDPELGVPITDLGLVYAIEDDGQRVRVVMTTTTPICPLGAFLRQQVERRLAGREVTVELVHQPLWSPEMMNDRARRLLRWDCSV